MKHKASSHADSYQEIGLRTFCCRSGSFRLWMLPLVVLTFSSCEKVIQLKLNNTAPKVVIQGTIYDHPGPYTIKISKSVNFDQTNDYPPVAGANVVVSDNAGQTETLSETVTGTYTSSKLMGIPGRTYTLTVRTDGNTYRSTAFMPNAVPIDSLYFIPNPFGGEKVTTIRFIDPPTFTNFYRMVYFVNGAQQKRFYVYDDELFNGKLINYSLAARDNDTKLKTGDMVEVWLESVDQGVYEYFRTTGHNDGNSASPSNPVSNISNGALGYFNACSVRKISAAVR